MQWNSNSTFAWKALLFGGMLSFSPALELSHISLGTSFWHSSLKSSTEGLRSEGFNYYSLPSLSFGFRHGSLFGQISLPLTYSIQGDESNYGFGDGNLLLGYSYHSLKIYAGSKFAFYSPNQITESPFLGSGNITPYVAVAYSAGFGGNIPKLKWGSGAKFNLPIESSFTDYNLLLGSWSAQWSAKLSYSGLKPFSFSFDGNLSLANNLWKFGTVYVDESDYSLGLGPAVSYKLAPGYYLGLSGGYVIWNYNNQFFSNSNSDFSEEKNSFYLNLAFSKYF